MLFSITAGMPGFMACACRRLHKFSIPAIWLLMLGADRANAQTVCGSVPEGGTLTLTAPAGQVFYFYRFCQLWYANGQLWQLCN